MRTGKNRYTRDASNVTVTIGGVRVHDGDLVLGDIDGVVVVPRAREDEILDQALKLEAREASIRRAVEGGMRLDEARKTWRLE